MRKVIVIGTLVLVIAGGAYAFRELGSWLSASDPVRSVDLVVALTGDLDARVPTVLDQLRAGQADEAWILIASRGPVVPQRELVERYVARRGLGNRVTVLGPVRTDRGGAVVVARRLERTPGMERVALVTAPWNLARAQLTYSRLLRDGVEVLAWSDGTHFSADRWWAKDASVVGLETVKLIGTLALFGARPTSPSEGVPLRLPATAAVVGAVVGGLAGAVCRPLARRLRLVAHPRLFRAHAYPVPLLGGLAILTGLGAGVLAGGGFSVGAAGGVAAGGVITLALVGFVDDVVGLGARSRLFWAALIGMTAWLLGLRVEIFGPGVAGEIGDAALTVVWFVGITHAMNLLDNTDGAAAGVGAVSSAAIAMIAIVSGQWVVAVGAAALAGACTGYLLHNVHPARLFMGDLGALGVGFSLAALTLGLRPTQRPPVSFAVAVFAVGVPIFDTVLVTISRLRAGRRVSAGGTDHAAHRLIARGSTVRRASATLWGAQVLLGGAAFAVATAPRAWAWAVITLIGSLGLWMLWIFLRLPALRSTDDRGVDELVRGIDRAVGSLRDVVRPGRPDGLAEADPGAMRVAQEALTRLERTRRLLRSESADEGGAPED